MGVKRFEELDCWKLARVLVGDVYQLSSEACFDRDYSLMRQIRSAAVSVMSNIAEGFDRRIDREFVRFLTISSASLSEVQSQMYVALDLGYVKKEKFQAVYNQSNRIQSIINGLIRHLTRVD